MSSNNLIEFKIQQIPKGQEVKIDGIQFSEIAFIQIFIDGENLINSPIYEGSFVVFDELSKSSNQPGEYLIFTSVSGIADDNGWDYVSVEHQDKTLNWNFERDDLDIRFSFNKELYKSGISLLSKEISQLASNICLEPDHVIYPE